MDQLKNELHKNQEDLDQLNGLIGEVPVGVLCDHPSVSGSFLFSEVDRHKALIFMLGMQTKEA